jgi:hypothetical protein
VDFGVPILGAEGAFEAEVTEVLPVKQATGRHQPVAKEAASGVPGAVVAGLEEQACAEGLSAAYVYEDIVCGEGIRKPLSIEEEANPPKGERLAISSAMQ